MGVTSNSPVSEKNLPFLLSFTLSFLPRSCPDVWCVVCGAWLTGRAESDRATERRTSPEVGAWFSESESCPCPPGPAGSGTGTREKKQGGKWGKVWKRAERGFTEGGKVLSHQEG